MKSSFKILCLTLFSLFLISPFAFAEETTPAETMVDISRLMTSTDQYPDNIIVHGFVSKVFPQDNLINLIDYPEVKTSHQSAAKQCPMKTAMNSVKGCPVAAAKTSYGSAGNIPTLPVQWNGDMPKTATFVQVTGKITQKDGEMLFVAESVQVMSN